VFEVGGRRNDRHGRGYLRVSLQNGGAPKLQTPGVRGVPRGPRNVSQQPRDSRAMQGYPGAIKYRGGDANP
jgi:hypothetical protein